MTRNKSEDSPDALLGDLESIRTLLDETPAGRPGADSTNAVRLDDQVPLLEDVVTDASSIGEDALQLDEGAVAAKSSGADTGGIDDALFDALLDDNWKETAAELLLETRSTIEKHSARWTQQNTEDLIEALRVRIDATLAEWLRNVVRQNVADLRSHLLQVTQAELAASVTRLLNDDRENRSAGSADKSAGSEKNEDG